MTEPLRAIDPAFFDPDTAASDDFYRHVNGGWIDANPVPSEYGAWGAPQIVHERNQKVLHQLHGGRRGPGRSPRIGGPDGGRLLRGGDG